MELNISTSNLDSMIREQLIARGIKDPRVIEAFKAMPREFFVPPEYRSQAYDDGVLPITEGQTISQPYIVAYMLQALDLKPTDKVLEVGTGSAYNTALLSYLVRDVYSIEIVESLYRSARVLLRRHHKGKIHLKWGDGYLGWPTAAPFDAIILTAAPAQIPDTLFRQLKDGGRLIAPEGKGSQNLNLYSKIGDKIESKTLLRVKFVPMIKKESY